VPTRCAIAFGFVGAREGVAVLASTEPPVGSVGTLNTIRHHSLHRGRDRAALRIGVSPSRIPEHEVKCVSLQLEVSYLPRGA
jgi:hypothetical protein